MERRPDPGTYEVVEFRRQIRDLLEPATKASTPRHARRDHEVRGEAVVVATAPVPSWDAVRVPVDDAPADDAALAAFLRTADARP